MTPVIVILWLAFGITSALIAREKNRSFGYFFVVGVLLGPIGVVIALCSKRWHYNEQLGITGSAAYIQRYLDEAEDEPVSEELRNEATPSDTQELIQLADLHRSGALTDSEFAAAKSRLLGR